MTKICVTYHMVRRGNPQDSAENCVVLSVTEPFARQLTDAQGYETAAWREMVLLCTHLAVLQGYRLEDVVDVRLAQEEEG